MRLFIAINISEENREKIFRIQSGLKKSSADIKWVRKENLHFTLKFLGETEESVLTVLKEKINSAIADIKPFDISFSNCGFFPSEISPRIFWIGIDNGSNYLCDIAGKIDMALEKIGFPKETRPFSAHLTIGRFRSGKDTDKLIKMAKKTIFENISETVNSIFIMKSTLTPAGPVYEIVEEFRLAH